MRKLSTLALAAVVAASFATSAFAGPSRAIIQEMGSVVPAGEVNVDLNVINLTGTGAAGTGNGTVGATAIHAVNVGLGNGFEVRTGAFPGLSGSLTGGSNGLTVKYAGFMPGLAIYGSYGNVTTTPAAATDGSAMRIGAAYTATVQNFILNGNIDFGSTAPAAAGAVSTNTTDIAVAALYPVTPNILVGGEYLNTSLSSVGTTNVSALGLGGRAIVGKFTVDALIYANVNVAPPAPAAATGGSGLGMPVLVRLNYAF